MDVNHTVKMIYFQTVMILNNYVKKSSAAYLAT